MISVYLFFYIYIHEAGIETLCIRISLGKNQYMSKLVMITGNQKRDDVVESVCCKQVVHVNTN